MFLYVAYKLFVYKMKKRLAQPKIIHASGTDRRLYDQVTDDMILRGGYNATDERADSR